MWVSNISGCSVTIFHVVGRASIFSRRLFFDMWQEQFPRIQFTARSESVNEEEKNNASYHRGSFSHSDNETTTCAARPLSCALCARALMELFYLFWKTMRFFVRKSCGKSHFFLVEKSIVVSTTQKDQKNTSAKKEEWIWEAPSNANRTRAKKRGGDWRYRSPYPSNANRMLYPLIKFIRFL